MTKEFNLQTATTSDNRETVNDNIPLTVRKMEAQAPKQPRPQRPYKKINQKSDWSDSENEKDVSTFLFQSGRLDHQICQPCVSFV